ncbi:MAG: LVIVD repeat-containing protein, partial [bacterium]
MRQHSPSYGGIWCALYIILLILIPSPLSGQVVVQGITPTVSLQTSQELFFLSGQGFSSEDTVVLVGSPPRTRWQLPAIDPEKHDQGARISTVKVRGNRAYVVEDATTLHILNIEAPEQPVLLGTLSDNRFGNITQIWPTDKYLYMADLNYGIWVADIADPMNPFLVGNGGPNYSFPTPTTTGLFVRGTTIFSINWQTGLQIIEQIPNGQLRPRGSIPISGTPFDIVLNESIAYVAIGPAVQIFNVGNMDNPTYLSQMTQIPSDAPNIRKLAIKDNVLYLVDRDFGIHVADLVTPAAPKIIASLFLTGQTKAIHITGTFAITANGYKGLHIINLARKESPRIFGNIYTHGDATEIAPYPGYLLIANGIEGLGIVEAPSFTHPAFLASFPTGDYPWAIACKEDFAFLSNGRSGLRVIRTAQPRLPKIVSTIPTTQTATFSAVSGNTLYLADSTRFRTYDISIPSLPLSLGSLALNDIIMSFVIHGNYAYLANFGFWVKSVDISKPKTPLLKGSAYSDYSWGLSSDIDFDQGIAYVANGPAGLWIIDFYIPSSPLTLSDELTQFSMASNIKKYQDRLYLTNGPDGIEV